MKLWQIHFDADIHVMVINDITSDSKIYNKNCVERKIYDFDEIFVTLLASNRKFRIFDESNDSDSE